MKRITRTAIAIILTLVVCTTLIPEEKAGAKNKNIYFAGEYRMKISKKEKYVLKLNQYSSPEGKKVGNMELLYCSRSPLSNQWLNHPWFSGELKKIGKNKYKWGRYTVKIYKKKLKMINADEYTGTYKLTKRYPKP